MTEQYTLKTLHDKLGALLKDGADPDTPIVLKDYHEDEYNSGYERVTEFEVESVSSYDYDLMDIVTRDSIVLE